MFSYIHVSKIWPILKRLAGIFSLITNPKIGRSDLTFVEKIVTIINIFFLVMLIERRSNSTTSLHVGGTRKYSFEFCIENCKNASETIDFNRGYIIYFKNGNVVIILCSIQIM